MYIPLYPHDIPMESRPCLSAVDQELDATGRCSP